MDPRHGKVFHRKVWDGSSQWDPGQCQTPQKLVMFCQLYYNDVIWNVAKQYFGNLVWKSVVLHTDGRKPQKDPSEPTEYCNLSSLIIFVFSGPRNLQFNFITSCDPWQHLNLSCLNRKCITGIFLFLWFLKIIWVFVSGICSLLMSMHGDVIKTSK